MKNELKHYGVLGMRWGVRRGKDNLASRTSSRTTRGLESRLEKDKKRVAKGKSAKYDTEALKKGIQKSKAEDKKLNKYVSSLSKGKVAAQVCLMGSRGALRYNQMRMKGKSRLLSAGTAYATQMLRGFGLETFANQAISGATSSVYEKGSKHANVRDKLPRV